MRKGSSMLYARPVLIYDDYCSSCTRFAKISVALSRRRIYAVGHYTVEGMQIKSEIFPGHFDTESMFWIVTKKGVFGGRSGLLPLAWETVKGFLGMGKKVGIARDCEYTKEQERCLVEYLSCSTTRGFISRLSGLLRNGKKIKRVHRNEDTFAAGNSAD